MSVFDAFVGFEDGVSPVDFVDGVFEGKDVFEGDGGVCAGEE